MDKCIICHGCENLVTLKEKGANGINSAARRRNNSLLAVAGHRVHSLCRRTFTNPSQINKFLNENREQSDNDNDTRTLRSSQTETFSFQTHCMFCAQPAFVRGKKRGYDVFPVRTIDFKKSILSACVSRNDDWANSIRGRIETVNDLHAADAIYHQMCSVNFRTGKNIPSTFYPRPDAKKGRLPSMTANSAFNDILTFLLDHEDDQHDLSDLVTKMHDICGEEAYTPFYLKQKLKESFGDEIIMTESRGKSTVITIRKTAASILNAFHEQPPMSDEDEKLSIIKTAANLIKSDVKALNFNCDCYPSSSDLSSLETNLQYLPDSLRFFLSTVIKVKAPRLKVASIGQAIMQAIQPRCHIAPLQIGLGVQLHHHFASRFLLDLLHNLGFCSSYQEIQRFEACAAVSSGTTIPDVDSNQFMQFVGVNVDHDIRTLDGKGTFHGMGIIAAVTPGKHTHLTIHRRHVSTDELEALGKIKIHFLHQPSTSTSNLKFNAFNTLETGVIDPTKHFDVVSKIIWPLKRPTPSWSGLMQMCHNGSHPGKSSVFFLPMIDMNASDMSCIYSTLRFVVDQSAKYNKVPVITFDQPLYWKALMICTSEPTKEEMKDVVLRLGGFHLEMSFLGCIGHIMRNSGLQEVIETVYAPNAVTHMLSGKAVSRAVRAHGLVETALYWLLVSNLFGIADPDATQITPTTESNSAFQPLCGEPFVTAGENVQTDSENKNLPEISSENSIVEKLPNLDPVDVPISSHSEILDKLTSLYDDLIEEKITIRTLLCDQNTMRVIEVVETKMKQLRINKTSALWIQYMEMVNLLHRYIRAERTGNFNLHLQCVREMLPYLASAGHNHYTKSAYIYLQMMQKLQTDHPDVYASFQSGYHVVRRSDRYWGGLSSDLVIEQVLMRSLKTTGGLTRGRGMTPIQRAQWLMSMPACAEINESMQSLSGTEFLTSDQHKDASTTRKERDMNDIEVIASFLKARDPFSDIKSLRNIYTGMVADNDVNVYLAYDNGQKILSLMENNNVFEYSFKRSLQVKTIPSESCCKSKEDILVVDPQLLFQRLLAISRDDHDLADLFKYELSTFPSSLFENNGLPRLACKAQLADTLWKMQELGEVKIDKECVKFVIDGGYLLHKIPWPKCMTYEGISNIYVDYLKRKYPNSIVVFDGYRNGPSIKDMAHIRRTKGVHSPEINFTKDTPCKMRKDVFLANEKNKAQFIKFLGNILSHNGYVVKYDPGDADRLIVLTAVEYSAHSEVVVVGEDTDLLVLLCYYANPDNKNIIFGSDDTRNKRKWDLKKEKLTFGSTKTNVLPAIHALTGCDSTSRLYGIGKGQSLKKLYNEKWLPQLETLSKSGSSNDEVIAAGEHLLCHLYGGAPHDGLDHLRFRQYTCKAFTKTTRVQIQSLPPTSNAAAFHSLRAYYQCQEWINETGTDLDPCDWGYQLLDGKYKPIKSTKSPAPEKLLKVIHCNCKQNCDNNRCTCRKHGLECSVGCGECRGFSCSNKSMAESDN